MSSKNARSVSKRVRRDTSCGGFVHAMVYPLVALCGITLALAADILAMAGLIVLGIATVLVLSAAFFDPLGYAGTRDNS